jgi:hypothetical protein
MVALELRRVVGDWGAAATGGDRVDLALRPTAPAAPHADGADDAGGEGDPASSEPFVLAATLRDLAGLYGLLWDGQSGMLEFRDRQSATLRVGDDEAVLLVGTCVLRDRPKTLRNRFEHLLGAVFVALDRASEDAPGEALVTLDGTVDYDFRRLYAVGRERAVGE